MTYAKLYPTVDGYAVLDYHEGEKPRRGKKVFHRVTKNGNLYCNGTDVLDSERREIFEEIETGTPPCKRCFG
jgi:hypothetical protein